MKRAEINEAATILRRLLAQLLLIIEDVMTEESAQARQTIGQMSANAEKEIAGFTFGTSLADCFVSTRMAGATFNSVDAIRLSAIAEDPIGTPATIVVDAYVQQSLVAMARIVADLEFESRDQVENYRSRLSSAFDVAEEDAANEGDAAAYQSLVTLHAMAVRDMTARARPLPRVVNYAFSMRYPVVWIANRLYGNGARFSELISENHIMHPLFAPMEGRALSR